MTNRNPLLLIYMVMLHLVAIASVATISFWSLSGGSQTMRVSYDLIPANTDDWEDAFAVGPPGVTRTLVSHALSVDGSTVVELAESELGVGVLQITPPWTDYTWTFRFPGTSAHGIRTGAAQVVTTHRDYPSHEVDWPDGRTMTWLLHVDEDSDGVADVRVAHEAPIDPDRRPHRWRLREDGWILDPFDEETGE